MDEKIKLAQDFINSPPQENWDRLVKYGKEGAYLPDGVSEDEILDIEHFEALSQAVNHYDKA